MSGHQKPVINSSSHLNRPALNVGITGFYVHLPMHPACCAHIIDCALRAHPCSAWPWALFKQASERLPAAEGRTRSALRDAARRNHSPAVLRDIDSEAKVSEMSHYRVRPRAGGGAQRRAR
jgi:hypothetical protein